MPPLSKPLVPRRRGKAPLARGEIAALIISIAPNDAQRSALLGVSVRTVARWRQTGKVPRAIAERLASQPGLSLRDVITATIPEPVHPS